MKRTISFIIALVAIITGANAQNNSFAWYGSDGIAKVKTGLGNDSNTEGIWKVFDDSGDAGESKVVWDVETADGNPDDNLVQQYGGISGKAVLGKGKLTYDPFAGVGFDVAGDYLGSPAAANASAWEGIAIAYQSDVAPILELSLGDAVDQAIGYAYPRVQLQASPEGITFVRIPWSDFKQRDTYQGPKISGPDAAKQLVSIRFTIQAPSGSYHFNIIEIGEYNMVELYDRTIISSVQATTSDIWFIPKFDEALTKPTINVTKGKPAYFDTSNGCWQKKGGKWEDVEDGTFSTGVWRFKCQLRIDKTTDPNNWFVLDKNVDVTINSLKWKKGEYRITKDYSYIEMYSPEFEVEDPDNPIEERTEIALVEGTCSDIMTLPEIGGAVEPPVFTTTSEEPVTFCFDTDGCWQKKVNGKWEDVESGEFSAGTWRFKCQVWVDDEAYVLAENVTVNIDGTDWDCDAVTIGDSYSYTYVYSPEIELEDGEEPTPAEKCDTPTIAFENGKLKFECATTDVEFVTEITAVDAKKYNSSEVSLTGIYQVSVYAKKEGWQDSDTVTKEIKVGAQMGDMNEDGILSVTDVGILITKILSGK